MKVKETYAFEHKGITIYVRINYRTNSITLVEPTASNNEEDFKAKQWSFRNRGVEYMAGWRNILGAMIEATKDAEKRYLADHAENSRINEDMIEKVLAVDAMKKKEPVEACTCSECLEFRKDNRK